MRTTPRRTRLGTLLLGAALLALPTTLSACGGDDSSEASAEKIIEANGGGDVDVDIDGDEVTIESSEGTVTTGSDLPDDFPADEIPLVDEEIVAAASGTDAGTNGGFVIGMTSDRSAEDLLAEAVGLLEDAGFTDPSGGEGGVPTLGGARLEKTPYTVLVLATPGEGGSTTLQYIVGVD